MDGHQFWHRQHVFLNPRGIGDPYNRSALRQRQGASEHMLGGAFARSMRQSMQFEGSIN